MKETIHNAEDKMKKALESTKRYFNEVRTGRATAALVEGIRINYYDAPTMLKQLATISVPEAHLLTIQPWDVSVIPEIEKEVLKSNLGITPSNDGKLIRLSFPPLSRERREELAKVVKKMAEDGRISLRTIRRDANEAIKKLEADKVISEDERFAAQDNIQKLTDKYIASIDEILEEKEKELSGS
ncbi:MAG: ribosome recycling factor [Candidatus Omnitrophica bacterium CG11_big_fil_rev_8_21_14_0_20_42_13]|uniref:Ribosome-recycling factor n=1 Tax=Candidatus Ghiorseimicrobium undicola TaxID=1974746 RepID=A0A2H0LWW7_9BACT|nr:MAG: ribosome recycling factor [Candidatus Omnitrophica bacterium CG11_big_fil_rev_8_21_14_0_20_42_13]